MLELIGRQLGEYQIQEIINAGGMAVIFKAYQPSLERHVALKVLPPTLVAHDARFRQRFEREVQVIAWLDHPNIVPVYDFGVEGVYSYIAMRYVVNGQTLRRLVNQPPNQPQIINLISQVASALAHAHERGVIHRDVKPGNVLLDGGQALLSDFGLAKISYDSQTLTGGSWLGTPLYMAPEQFHSLREIDHRADIYALGVIPHQAVDAWAIALQRSQNPPLTPHLLNPAISPSLEQVVLRALAIQPEERYQNALDFATALQILTEDKANQEPRSELWDETTVASMPKPHFTSQARISKVSVVVTEGAEPAPSSRKNAIRRRLYYLLPVIAVLIALITFLWNSTMNVPAIRVSPTPTVTTATITSVLADTLILSQAEPQPSKPPSEFLEIALTSEPQNEVLPQTATSRPPTSTTSPSSTQTPTLQPTPSPTQLTLTATATFTPLPPPPVTPSPLPITPTASSPNGIFTLLKPTSLDEPSYGPTDFEWQWTGPIPAGFGFEIRIWREGEPPAGVHNALEDNQNGRIMSLGENRYRLSVDIRDTPGVRNRQGEYWWTVVLIQINPTYADLGQQAVPARLRFEPGGTGGGRGGEGGGSGYIN